MHVIFFENIKELSFVIETKWEMSNVQTVFAGIRDTVLEVLKKDSGESATSHQFVCALDDEFRTVLCLQGLSRDPVEIGLYTDSIPSIPDLEGVTWGGGGTQRRLTYVYFNPMIMETFVVTVRCNYSDALEDMAKVADHLKETEGIKGGELIGVFSYDLQKQLVESVRIAKRLQLQRAEIAG